MIVADPFPESSVEIIFVRRTTVTEGSLHRSVSYTSSQSRSHRVWIPSSVEVLTSKSFAFCPWFAWVVFEPHSRLHRIDSFAFQQSSIRSVSIPATVEVIGQSAFSVCQFLASVMFEPGSRLRRIDCDAFAYSALPVIVLPRNLEIFEPSAFAFAGLQSILVERNCERFEVHGDFLVAVRSRTVLQYCGSEIWIVIPRCIRNIGGFAFLSSGVFSSVVFDYPSNVRRTGFRAFSCRSLRVITIPASVEIIGALAFVVCRRLQSVLFEQNSRLKRIDWEAFSGCPFREIVLPDSLLRISGSAFLGIHNLTVRFDGQNGVFRAEANFLLDVRERLVCGIDGADAVVIPACVDTIGSWSFAHAQLLNSVSFPPDIQLRRIDSHAFSKTHLEAIAIPRSVETIGPFAFEGSSLSSLSFEPDSQLKRIEHQVFAMCPLADVAIPPSVEIIGSGAFLDARFLSNIAFGSGSQLKRIEAKAFAGTAIVQIDIPAPVGVIVGSAFLCSHLQTITVDSDNAHFRIEGNCLIEIAHNRLVRSFQSGPEIVVPNWIEIIGSACFAGCNASSSIRFEPGSQLKRIESYGSTILPPFKLTIPSTVLFVACDAIVTNASPETSWTVFEEWRLRHEADPDVDFRVPKACRHDLASLEEFLIDMTEFEPLDSGIGFHRRISDGLTIIVEPLLSVGSMEASLAAIEARMAIEHPCLIPPFGFLVQKECNDVMIATVRYPGDSLSEVLANPPVWWNWTAKSKTLVGIALGMGFLHSCGISHGNLTPNNIVFDAKHEIHITGFGGTRLATSGRAGKGADIFAYGGIVRSVLSEEESDDISDNVTEAIRRLGDCITSETPSDRPSFRRIFETLKSVAFEIVDEVDSNAVFDFVRSIDPSCA
jgi:tRNA A-37 threonylcarbamoyl transferase component Bud32